MEKKPSKYKIQKEEIPEFNLSPEVERLQKQLDKDPRSKVFLPLAEEYRRSKMPEEAIFILEDGIKYNPAYTPAKIALARAYLDINELMKAKKVIDEILQKMPHNPLALKLHGDISFREGDFLEARKAYETAKSLNPMDMELDTKLSELQSGESGSKIEVATLTTHEEDMQIERSYIEHKTPGNQAVESIQPQDNLQGQPEYIDDINQPAFENIDPSQIPVVVDTPQMADAQLQYPQESNQFFQQENNQIVQEQFAQDQNQLDVPQADYAQQQETVIYEQSVPAEQHQNINPAEYSHEQPSYEQNLTGYSDVNQLAMPEVPLVSQEAILPERNYEMETQYSIQPENQDQVFQQPITQQEEYMQYQDSSPINQANIIAEADSGGFYTGPPTEPLMDNIDGEASSMQYVESPISEQTGIPQIQEGYPSIQSIAGEVQNNMNVQQIPYDISQIEQKIAQSSLEELYNNLDLSTSQEQQQVQEIGTEAIKAEEFGLNEIEGDIKIPVQTSPAGFVDIQKIIEQNSTTPNIPIMQPQTPSEERITIDSLEIEDVNLDSIAMEEQSNPQEALNINDIASEIKQQQFTGQGVGVVDIFKKPSDTEQSQQPLGNVQGELKYDMDLAELYTKQGHYDKSLEIYKKLLEYQPDNPELINRLIETEKMKNAEQTKEQSKVTPNERIAKMEEWFRALNKDKKES